MRTVHHRIASFNISERDCEIAAQAELPLPTTEPQEIITLMPWHNTTFFDYFDYPSLHEEERICSLAGFLLPSHKSHLPIRRQPNAVCY